MYYFKKLPLSSFLMLALATASACSHAQKDEFPITADPSEEMMKLEIDRDQAYRDQVNVLSPAYFDEFEDNLEEAREKRNKGKSSEDILKKLSVARSNLRKALEVSEKSKPILSPALDARSNALEAEAPVHVSKDFGKVDEDFKKVSKNAEKEKFKDVKKEVPSFQAKYLDLELRAIKEKYGRTARNTVDQAKKEDAQKLAPRTLTYTEGVLQELDSLITVDRHNTVEIEKKAQIAQNKADRLLRITREAKVANKRDSEDILLEKEKYANEVNHLRNVNQTMSQEIVSQDTFNQVSSYFSKDEAEVSQEDNKLVIRLKGLNFATGQNTIPPENYALLAKVQKAIQAFGNSRVTVEGHTDSVGSKSVNKKVSQARARAVKQYLLANNVLPENKITTVGYGYNKPVAANKSKNGRAINRRVDVIITPEQSAAL